MSKQRRTYTVQSVENGFDLIAALMLEKRALKYILSPGSLA